MDELENRLRGAYDAARAEAPQSGPEVYTAVRAGARRRRTMRGALTAAVTVVALGVVGMGAYGITTINRAEPALPVITPEPTASASADPTPEPAPSPTASAPEAPAVDPRFDDSPDGIAEDALPGLAADRGVLNEYTDTPVMYPEAHVMEDWVWGAVGDGWALDVASMQMYPYTDSFVQPAAVLYLVSPEDVHFELFELPERAWDDARVTSWREDQGIATIWWASSDGPDGARVGHGAQVDLRNGHVDDLVMSVYGETAWDYRFVMANGAGDELWRAESDAGFKYYRWSDGADEDGWVATALVDETPTADNAVLDIGLTRYTVTDDGDRVLMSLDGDRYDTAPSEVANLVTYDLAADRVQRIRVEAPVEFETIYGAAFRDHRTVIASLNSHIDSDDATSSHDIFNDQVEIPLADGARIAPTDSQANVRWGTGGPVGYGAPSLSNAGAESCGC